MSRYSLEHPEPLAVKRRSRRRRGGVALVAALLVTVPLFEAQASPAKRAIEDMERCSAEERKSGCVQILKQEKRGGGRVAIKAKIRGGRIIWYEYDRDSGRVRRTN